MKLDYTLTDPEERKKLVEQILLENPNPPNSYLEILADYMIMCMEKEERKNKEILTENRLSTVNKRETSYEGLAAQFENGEDNIYNLITEDKNILFRPKNVITKEDLRKVPPLRELREGGIEVWEKI